MIYEQVAKALVNEGREDICVYGSFGLWNEFSLVRSLVKEGKAEVVDSKFYSLYSWEKDRRPDIQTESTYSECLDMDFNVKSSVLTISMWDGDSFHGNKTTQRCEWQVKVKAATITFIKERVVAELKRHAQRLREKQILQEEQEKIDKIFKDLINKEQTK